MANTKRKDKSRKVLRKGESQRPDGTYQFRWTDENRKRHCIYARNLDDLRYKEDEIDKDKKDGIKAEARYTSLNDMYELWRDLKRGIKNNTFENYKYMYETSGALITMETENYQIDGKKGNWIATDTIIIDGKQFYLMEHQVYRDQAQGVILDAYGKMVVEECKKFDEKTKQKIHDYIQQQVPLNPIDQLKQNGKLRLEHYQKFYQNGTYERSRESGTEANYDMVDGLVNNQKKNPEKLLDARSNKQTPRNQQDVKPKKRRSVIKRLHQKQIAIARRSGKPIPKYLDQEMERKRG